MSNPNSNQAAIESYARLLRLIGNEDFRWFMREVVGRDLEHQRTLALDRGRSAAERQEAVENYWGLKAAQDLVTKERDAVGSILGNAQQPPVTFEP